MSLAADAKDATSSPRRWGLELSIAFVVLVAALGVWAYSHFLNAPSASSRPPPAWLAVSKVMSQMTDGRMVNIKVNLRLKNQDAVSELEPHVPAFRSLIQETGAQLNEDTLHSPDGARQLSRDIRSTINAYLKAHDVHARVKDVVFDELMLLP